MVREFKSQHNAEDRQIRSFFNQISYMQNHGFRWHDSLKNIMEPKSILREFREISEKIGIRVTERVLKKRPIRVTSGFCTVNGEKRLIIDKKLSDKDKIHFYVQSFAPFIIDDIYFAPYIREMIEKYREKNKITPKPLQ